MEATRGVGVPLLGVPFPTGDGVWERNVFEFSSKE